MENTSTEIPVPQQSSPVLVVISSLVFLIVGLFLGYAIAVYLPQTNILSKKPCTPRPACLDATPRCMIPETTDMCPPTISPTPSAELTGLKTFKDSLSRYQIQIPAEWKQVEQGSSFQNNNEFQAPDGSTLSISVLESSTESLDDFLAVQAKNDLTSWEGLPGRKVLSSKKTTIFGLPAVRREEEFLAADFTTVNTYLLINKQVYSFSIIPVEIPYDQTDIYAKYLEVLNTFEPLPDLKELPSRT